MRGHVYRRPFDYRAPRSQWLLLRPDLNITAGSQALALTEQAASATMGKGVSAILAPLVVVGAAADVNFDRRVTGIQQAIGLVGQGASISFSVPAPSSFTFRDVPPLVPVVRSSGVYRRSYTLRRSRPPVFIPAVPTTGNINADRGQLALQGQSAAITFQETVRPWILIEAIRQAALRRQLVYREPFDMRAWDERIVQFTLRTTNLTAYAAPLTLTGRQSTVRVSRAVNAQVASLIVTRPAAAVRLGKQIVASNGSLVITPQRATISSGSTIAATSASLNLVEQTADTDLDKAINAAAATLVLAELNASFGSHLNVAATVRVMALTEQASTVHIEKVVAALAAALALDEQIAQASVGKHITASRAALTISSQLGDSHFEKLIEAAVGQLTLEERRALITGHPVVATIGRRMIRVAPRNTTITVH